MRERSGRMPSFIEKRGGYNLRSFVKQPWVQVPYILTDNRFGNIIQTSGSAILYQISRERYSLIHSDNDCEKNDSDKIVFRTEHQDPRSKERGEQEGDRGEKIRRYCPRPPGGGRKASHCCNAVHADSNPQCHTGPCGQYSLRSLFDS